MYILNLSDNITSGFDVLTTFLLSWVEFYKAETIE